MTKFHNRTYHFHEFLGLIWQPNTSREQKSQRSRVNSSNKWATPSWETNEILEIKSVIWEIKCDKFWKSNVTKFGNQKCHLRNQMRQIVEIKSVIWEIKCDKFWKSKVSFEKSKASNFGNRKCQLINQNASNFGNQKCHLRNQNASNFGIQKCHLRNQTWQIWKSKVSFEKSKCV